MNPNFQEKNISKNELSFTTTNNLVSSRRASKVFNQSPIKGALHDFLINVKKIQMVKKAVERLKEMSSLRKPEYLKKYHYLLFQDETINPHDNKNENNVIERKIDYFLNLFLS
jgi:hypothetical protein